MAEEESRELKQLLLERVKLGHGLLSRCMGLEQRSIEGIGKLTRKIKAELKFLEMVKNKKSNDASYVKSTNLSHLQGVIKTVEEAEGVTALFKSYYYHPAYSEADQVAISVDVVAKKGSNWIKVIARNPVALHRIWQGEGNFGDRDLTEQAKELKECAVQNEVHFVSPIVVFSFQNGVTEDVAKALLEIGVCVEGEVIGNPGEEKPTMELPKPDADQLGQEHKIYLLNLDVSSMIAYVSSVTNGGRDFIFRDSVLTCQAEKELKDPLLPKLEEYCRGKELFACKSAVTDFKSIIQTIGGEKEKERARRLLDRVSVVDDEPSPRALRLKESASIRPRAKIVFGTGDTLKATTVTANAAFVRAAQNQGVEFSVLLHDSRALTESKESTATPLSNE
ncbi:UPF0415 protein C7orf25 [Nematostella vectensis]|uniref:UPF0415 protein C7orf25 n=1 Tax=Nematostella vectensis TaxID=45351 RepID=UPI002077482C|nr:UPF0415 protein C7orf25 [Nematostella vectensis]